MPRILIVESRFYNKISDMLLEGAINEIKKNNCDYEVITVPGAFEVPAVISFASKTNKNGATKYDGYVALGCVIRGETTHYDYVCSESARGLNDLAIKDGLAIGYGIITVENEAQAIARADIKQKDKGGFAAMACLKMIEIKKKYII